MVSKYEDIYSCFLTKITDPALLEQNEEDVYEFMKEWLHLSVSVPHLRRLFSTITFDDETHRLTFELKNSVDDETDEIFVRNIIAQSMLVSWLKPKVESTLNIHQMYGGKEQKFYAQANHLNTLMTLLDNAQAELRKSIRDYGYINNSYIRAT